jgi:hypothetical protein
VFQQAFEDIVDVLQGQSEAILGRQSKVFGSAPRMLRARWKQNNQTWVVPPAFLSGRCIESIHNTRLMEGHRSEGQLDELIRHELMSDQSKHKIWLGTTPTTTGGNRASGERS